jgi:hypothetical protein
MLMPYFFHLKMIGSLIIGGLSLIQIPDDPEWFEK